MIATPVTPPSPPFHIGQPLTHLYIERGAGITMDNPIGDLPPDRTTVVAGAPYNRRDLGLVIRTDCGAMEVRGNPVDFEQPPSSAPSFKDLAKTNPETEETLSRLVKVLPEIL